MKNLDRIKDIYQHLAEGKALDAFDKYYADNVVMIEGNGDKRVGKPTCREYEVNFFAGVQEFHGAGVDAFVSDGENTTMVENWMDVTFKDGNRMRLEQIARQTWEDGKIVEERFYYHG
ncbi:MAG: nuclear transport factor 2 family protein [Bacteroidota bacterium]